MQVIKIRENIFWSRMYNCNLASLYYGITDDNVIIERQKDIPIEYTLIQVFNEPNCSIKLDLNGLTNASSIIFPKKITGDLILENIENAENLVLPEEIGGTLMIKSKKLPKKIILPKKIHGSLDLQDFDTIENLNFPTVSQSIYIHTQTIQNCSFQPNLNCSLFITAPKKIDNIIMPQTIDDSLYLKSGHIAKIQMPEIVKRDLTIYTSKLENLILPKIVGTDAHYDHLQIESMTINNVILPESVANLNLYNLIEVKNCVFPKQVGGRCRCPKLQLLKNVLLSEFYCINLDTRNIQNIKFRDIFVSGRISRREAFSSFSGVEGNFRKYITNLDMITNPTDITLPKELIGDISLNGLSSAKGLIIPQKGDGDIYLNGLTSAEGLIFPETITGELEYHFHLCLDNPITLNDLGDILESDYGMYEVRTKKTNIIKGINVHLSGLKTAKGLKLPKKMHGSLWLDGLNSTEDLKFPENMCGNIYLNGLTSTQDLTLPKELHGDLHLDNLITAERLILPESMHGNIFLNKLSSTQKLVFPKELHGDLHLDNLITAEGLILPETIIGNLSLQTLINETGLKLPKIIDGDLHIENIIFINDNMFENITITGNIYTHYGTYSPNDIKHHIPNLLTCYKHLRAQIKQQTNNKNKKRK